MLQQETCHVQPEVRRVTSERNPAWRKSKLKKLQAKEFEDSPLSCSELAALTSALKEYHDVFSLEDEQRGETDVVKFHIDTGEAVPNRQPVRRIPFAVRQEIAKQLKDMQRHDAIVPSNSPWASPIVFVRKRDRTLRFCIEYWHLNAVTKSDTFPLLRIDGLLNQLGKSKFYSTLNLQYLRQVMK